MNCTMGNSERTEPIISSSLPVNSSSYGERGDIIRVSTRGGKGNVASVSENLSVKFPALGFLEPEKLCSHGSGILVIAGGHVNPVHPVLRQRLFPFRLPSSPVLPGNFGKDMRIKQPFPRLSRMGGVSSIIC
jgi:hypothetical protein